MKYGKYKITKEQQLKELISRVPPILNVNIVIVKKDKFLIGKRNLQRIDRVYPNGYPVKWLFPGGRVKFDEVPEQAAIRILNNETPGIKAQLKKLIAVLSDKGHDVRANGVSIYYLFDYKSGEPRANNQLTEFKWVNREDLFNINNFHSTDKGIVRELDAAIRTQNTTEDEILVEVDKNNKVIGSAVKRELHNTNKRYHRAAHIVIFNSKGEIILQQRSLTKSHGAGLWDVHGGHQVDGQTIEQTAMAELSEEMGITTNLQLKEVGIHKFKDQSEFYYLFYGISDGPYGYDRNEVEQLRAFDPEKILNGSYDKEYNIMPHILPYIKKLKDVWMGLRKNYSSRQ